MEFKLKKRLKQSHIDLTNRFKSLIESSSDWIWELDTEGNFTYSSPSIKKILGYAPEELINKVTRFDLMSPEEAEKTRDGYSDYFAVTEQFNTKISVNVHKDGHNVFMESSGCPFLDNNGELLGYRGVDREITERLRAEKELLRSNMFLEQLFNITHLSIVFLDRAFNFIRVNQTYADICGYAPDFFPGKNHFAMYPNTENKEIFRRVVETGEQFTILAKPFEFPDHPERGISYWDWTLTPIKNSADEVEWLIFALVDVTKTKQNEFGLIDAKEEAEKANLAKSEFLAVMSHEIRTPLNAILGMTEVAKERNQDPDLSRCLEIIDRSGNSLLSLISDILDLSYIESGRISVVHKPVHIYELIQEAVDIHSIKAKSKWVDLTCRMDPETPKQFEGDKKRLRQVLLNIVGNAVKFTDHGKVELQVSRPSPQTLQFSVLDSGVGIPKEKQSSIFEPFYQADSSNTRKHGGVGLGLTICKRLVDAMGGKIWVESNIGKGSTFRFSVPLSGEDQRITDQPSTVNNVTGQETRNPCSILLAEDNTDSALVIEAFLNNTPHQLDIVKKWYSSCL